MVLFNRHLGYFSLTEGIQNSVSGVLDFQHAI